jgi:hypothetical protein
MKVSRKRMWPQSKAPAKEKSRPGSNGKIAADTSFSRQLAYAVAATNHH